MKVYEYKLIEGGVFLVRRVDNKFAEDHKLRYQEYIVNLKEGETSCTCKGFYFRTV